MVGAIINGGVGLFGAIFPETWMTRPEPRARGAQGVSA
jgi:hypothetical protein